MHISFNSVRSLTKLFFCELCIASIMQFSNLQINNWLVFRWIQLYLFHTDLSSRSVWSITSLGFCNRREITGGWPSRVQGQYLLAIEKIKFSRAEVFASAWLAHKKLTPDFRGFCGRGYPRKRDIADYGFWISPTPVCALPLIRRIIQRAIRGDRLISFLRIAVARGEWFKIVEKYRCDIFGRAVNSRPFPFRRWLFYWIWTNECVHQLYF